MKRAATTAARKPRRRARDSAKNWWNCAARLQTEQEQLATGRAELAAMNERLAAAEAIATRLRKKTPSWMRREAALQQQRIFVNDESERDWRSRARS